MLARDLGEVGDDGGRPGDDRGARRGGGRLFLQWDPETDEAEDRLDRALTEGVEQDVVGTEGRIGKGEHATRRHVARADVHATHRDLVLARTERCVVDGHDVRQHETKLHGELAAQLLDASQQIATGDEVDAVVREPQLQRFDAHLRDQSIGIVRRDDDRRVDGERVDLRRGLDPLRHDEQPDGDTEEGELGHAGQ